MSRALPSNAASARSLRELALLLELDGVAFEPQALERAAACGWPARPGRSRRCTGRRG
ncbi:MAG: hypothetical protein FJ086_17180 [Deltaproteobacteria bacterium]|nr:hypothetical protein [Deltaproteobacteria bacterium]